MAEGDKMSKIIDHLQLQIKLRKLHSRVERPFRNVKAAHYIDWGRHVRIRKHAWFSLRPECKVSIGDNTRIGRHFIIAGVGNSIVIEEDVLMSERVFIAECNHDFQDVTRPVAECGVASKGPVRIGAGSWLGIGVCVLPGVTIGKHCVIGANAVVATEIPDYSMAVGNPARVIKRYDFEKKEWAPVGPVA